MMEPDRWSAGVFRRLSAVVTMVAKAIPILTSFVTKSGGAGVGNLLASVLR
jgi:hypothetical protein